MSGFELLLVALAMVFIVEGVLPFLSPSLLRRYMAQVVSMDDRSLRIGGLVSMLIGLALLYLFAP